jgi:hypothetical protein
LRYSLSGPCGTCVARRGADYSTTDYPYRSALTRCRTHRHSADASAHSAAKRTGAWSAAYRWAPGGIAGIAGSMLHNSF